MNQHILVKKRNYSSPQEENFSRRKQFKSNDRESQRIRVSTLSTFSLETETDSCTLDLRNEFSSSFFASLKAYLIKTVPCDLTLLLNSGKRLNAHRLLLVNSSAYFKRKIDQLSSLEWPAEENGNLGNFYTIKLTEIDDFKMLKVCIDFIYSGGTELNFEICKLKELHSTAAKLELIELTKICETIRLRNEQEKLRIQSLALQPFLNIFQNFNDLHNIQFTQPSAFYPSVTTTSHMYSDISQQNHSSQMYKDEIANENEPDQARPVKQTLVKKQNSLEKSISNGASTKLNPPISFVSCSSLSSVSSSPSSSSSSSSSSSYSASSPSPCSLSTSPIFMQSSISDTQNDCSMPNKETKTINTKDCFRFENSFQLQKIREYLNEKLEQAALSYSPILSLNNVLFEIDTIGSQFAILNKYIYPSMLDNNDESKIRIMLKKCLENFTYVNVDLNHGQKLKPEVNSEFNRDSLIVFCLCAGENKFNNFLIKSKLNFADINALKEDVKQKLEAFLVKTLYSIDENEASCSSRPLSESIDTCVSINRVFYLKKPANCRTIRLDQMKSSTDCFRAIVEYSRFNEAKERPLVFTTVHASVSLKLIK